MSVVSHSGMLVPQDLAGFKPKLGVTGSFDRRLVDLHQSSRPFGSLWTSIVSIADESIIISEQ
ncbi:hypothetical protein CHELA1G11_14275 [Hyphomicrobiales bacterium]|nr:hypothetical protein CHELA1G2_10038 [Hyphomicrobiales bacterium]CAH1677460.1 hypothetical protein CHELA1G11_14275 [Hyphomicrobiales bacterium]